MGRSINQMPYKESHSLRILSVKTKSALIKTLWCICQAVILKTHSMSGPSPKMELVANSNFWWKMHSQVCIIFHKIQWIISLTSATISKHALRRLVWISFIRKIRNINSQQGTHTVETMPIKTCPWAAQCWQREQWLTVAKVYSTNQLQTPTKNRSSLPRAPVPWVPVAQSAMLT